MSVYYNEFDPQAAAWIRELIKAGLIPAGDVDERSIEDVTPNELRGYTQCHFFAGIAGWAYALDLAGWPRDRPVWTGSCPCQPFSAAGKGAGFADERHLWPAWQHLIAQCRPPIVFGEQVASKNAGAWIDLVHADMEGMGYAFGCIPFPAAGVGAPHIRDRNYWVADADSQRYDWIDALLRAETAGRNSSSAILETAGGGTIGVALGDTSSKGLAQRISVGRVQREAMGAQQGEASFCSSNASAWACDWLQCRDGKARPVEPGTFPLAHGIPGRVVRLRGYGNAIVPQQAAQFVRAYLESRASVAVAA